MEISTDVEKVLFSGLINEAKLADLIIEFTDDTVEFTRNFNFISYEDFNEVHWLNIPGPIYTTYTDNCGTGQIEAMNNVGGDEGYHEIIFKQPSTKQELKEVLTAAVIDPFDAYYLDGNQRWTKELVIDWWLDSQQRVNYILDRYEDELNLPPVLDRPYYWPRKPIPDNYKNWLDFYQQETREYLEWYLWKLCNERIILRELKIDWARKKKLDDELSLKKSNKYW